MPDWVWKLGEIVATAASAAVPVIGWLRTHVKRVNVIASRLDVLESDRKTRINDRERQDKDISRQMLATATALTEHEDKDDERFKALQEQTTEINDTVIRTEEIVTGIKETLNREYDETNRRITAHEQRNSQNVKEMTNALNKLTSRVEVLDDRDDRENKSRRTRND